MKTIRTRKSSRVLVGSIALLLAVQSAQAASQFWDGNTSALWSLGTNWLGNPPDAAVPATGNTATFNSANGADDVIDLGAGVTIDTILFATASAAAYTIGSGAVGAQTLTLDNGGAVTVNSTVANDQLFNANLILGNDGTAQTFTFTNNSINNLTFAGNITGSSGAGRKTMVVTGAGNTTISGAISGLNDGNWVNGEAGTQVNGGGTLQIGNGGMTGSITGDVFLDNGVLQFNRAGTYTFGGVIADFAYLSGYGGTGSVRQSGPGTLILTANNVFRGGTTISGGILQIGHTGALAAYGLTVNGGELDLHTFNLDVSSLQGSGGVISDESSDPGTTTLNVGQYETGTGTFGGVIRDGGQGRQVALAMSSGTQVLSGSNTYSGNTSIYSSAVLQFAKEVSLYNNVPANWTAANIYVEGTIAFNVGGTGEFTNGDITDYLLPQLVGGGALQSGAAIGFDTTNAAAGTFTIADDLSDSGNGPLGVTKLGSGTLVLSGANTSTGATTVTAGTLQFAKQESLYNNTPASWTAANINVKSAATLALNVDSTGTNGFTVANLNALVTNISVAGSATAGLQSGAILGFDTSTATAGTFTQGNALADSTGANGGAIGVTKLGAGTLVFDKANTYTGATTVRAGTLQLGINNGIASGNAVTVAPTGASAALDLAGFDQTIGGAGLTLGGASASSAATVISSAGVSILTLSGGATAATYNATNDPLGATISVASLTLANAPQTFTVGDSASVTGSANELTVSSSITAAGVSSALVKAGTGSLKLDGAQNYDTLTVTEGTLSVNGEVGTIPASGTASVVVAAGAKLQFGRVSQTLSSLTIGAGATVTFTSGVASGAFGGGGGKTVSFGSSTVPEPGTLGLLLLGALGVLHRRRRHA